MDKSKALKVVQEFIRQRGYTFTAESLLETYQNYYKKGWYINFTAEDCINHLKVELEVLVE